MEDELLTPIEVLILKLHSIGAVQFGKFTLSSGKKSNVYLDLRILVSYPETLAAVAGVYHHFINRLSLEFDLLTAPPMAGLPMGTALCLEMKRPCIYPRKTAKSYGMGKGIEGVYANGQRVLVVDDVITSGGSIVEAVAVLKAAGLRVQDAIVLIDREQGGKEILAEEGYQLHSIMTLHYILSVLRDNDRISQKQYEKTWKSIN